MKRAAMVALACLTDAYIGALIADELATRFGWGIYAWPVGALLGGSIAYIIHDIKAFCSGIKRAFDEVTGWQPDVQWWKAYAKAVLYFGGMPSGIVFWMVASMGFTIDLYAKAPTFNWLFVAFYASLLVFLICFLISFTLSAGEEREKLEKTAQRIKKIFRYTNHIALPFWAVYCPFRGIRWLFVNTPSAKEPTWCFMKTAFRYVHSDIRKLCFVDAALGASAGFSLGSPLIGGVIGLIIGVINYELVSVKILKLVPHRR